MGYDTMTSLKQLNAGLRHSRTGIRIEAYSVEHLVELAYFNILLLCGYARVQNRADLEAFTFSTSAKPSEALHVVTQNIQLLNHCHGVS